MRLLLVEDDAMIGEAVRTGLRQDGFTVDWVRDAEAGDAALKAETYALLLLDLGLPDIHGHEVIPRILEVYPPAKILALSEHESREIVSQALSSGEPHR